MDIEKRRLELKEIEAFVKDKNGKTTFGELYDHFAISHDVAKKDLWSYLQALKVARKIRYPESFISRTENEIEIELIED